MKDASFFLAVLRSNVATMTYMSVEELDFLQPALTQHGYQAFLADLSGAEDEIEMFLRVVAAIPGCRYAALHSNINLAALEDILREVVWDEGNVALIVENAEELVRKHLNLLFDVHSIITLVTEHMRMGGAKGMIRIFLVCSTR